MCTKSRGRLPRKGLSVLRSQDPKPQPTQRSRGGCRRKQNRACKITTEWLGGMAQPAKARLTAKITTEVGDKLGVAEPFKNVSMYSQERAEARVPDEAGSVGS